MRQIIHFILWPAVAATLLGSALAAFAAPGDDDDVVIIIKSKKSLDDPDHPKTPPHALLNPKQLADKLDASKGERIDVELRSGKSLIRCKLIRMTRDSSDGPPKTLRLEVDDSPKPRLIDFSAVRSLSIAREVVFEAEADKNSVRDVKREKDAKAAAEERAKWVARALKRDAEPWPELSSEEHKEAIEENEAQFEKAKKLFPDLEMHETGEFMFCTNIPNNQVGPYIASLDKMYDTMSVMYGIKKGTAVFKGKCLVFAFLEESQFQQFEVTFYHSMVSNAYGICHRLLDGRVVVSCFRGDNANDFAQMLVHETSHGFMYRYRTSEGLPSWVNEGMAEWIGVSMVPKCTSVKDSVVAAVQSMKATHSMNGLFNSQMIIMIHHSYGMATGLTDFMIRTDRKKYVDFIQGMKEGKNCNESLRDSYHFTPEQLAAAYGSTIGIPDLRP